MRRLQILHSLHKLCLPRIDFYHLLLQLAQGLEWPHSAAPIQKRAVFPAASLALCLPLILLGGLGHGLQNLVVVLLQSHLLLQVLLC